MMPRILLFTLLILAITSTILAQVCTVEELMKACEFEASFSAGDQQVKLEALLTCPLTEDIPNADDNQIPTAQEQATLLEETDQGCNCAAQLLDASDGTLLADAKEMNCQCFGCPSQFPYPYAFKCDAPIAGPCTAFDCEFKCNGLAGLESAQDEEIGGGGGSGCPVQENLEQCTELLQQNDIPCRCSETDCIAFSNGRFADCVDGSTAFVSGSTASGCTIQAHAPEDFNCTVTNEIVEQSYCGSEPCFVALPLSCSDMIDLYTFQGSCCSMESDEDTGGCRLTVADIGNCFWAPKEGECDKEEASCNIVFTTDAESVCPESDFNALGVEAEETVNCGNNNCNVTVPVPCEQLVEEYTFQGTCCSLAALVEEDSECVISVADEGSCMWYPTSLDTCRDELNCYKQYVTDSTDACPESEYNVLADNPDTPDIPEISNECSSAILLQAGEALQGNTTFANVDAENEPACGEHGDQPGVWYMISAGQNTTNTVYVCTNSDDIVYFSVFVDGCEAQHCLGSSPVRSAPRTCGENHESFAVVTPSEGEIFIRVGAEQAEISNFEIWYEVEGGDVQNEELEYITTGDTTVVRNGENTEVSLGSDETFLVQHSTSDSELPSTYALLEFTVDLEEMDALDLASVELCLERVPRADIFDHTHTYSVCVLAEVPPQSLESITGEMVNLTMPESCLDGLTVEFDVGPTSETIQCIDLNPLLLESNEEPEDGDAEASRSRKLRKLRDFSFVLMIDNMIDTELAGDRWYSRESTDGTLPPSLVFVPSGSELDVVPGKDCLSDGPVVICPAGGSFEVEGQSIIVDADLECPMEAVDEFGSFEEASQVFGLCSCVLNIGNEEDVDNPDLEVQQEAAPDADLNCSCYACPEDSVLPYAYDCGASPLVSNCLRLNCNGTCNGELDNVVFLDEEDGSPTATPIKTLPPSTLDPNVTTLAPTVNSTTNSTEDEDSGAVSRHSLLLLATWSVMVMGLEWVAFFAY